MRRKKFVIVTTILFIYIITLPFSHGIIDEKTTNPIDKNNILNVGGSGPGNYSKIQDAINNSYDLDTIYVYDDNSPYYENLIINKSIFLIGEDKNTTIIDGSGSNNIILIRIANYVHISGFTIRNSSHSEIKWDSLRGVGIRLLAATYCNISNIIITQTDVGIHLLNYIWTYFTHHNTIEKNIFKNNVISIALDWGSGYSSIKYNEFKQNVYGIVIITTNYNFIMENNFLVNFRSVYLRPDIIWPEGDPLDEINHNTWFKNYWLRPRFIRVLFGRARVVYDHASWYVRYIELDWNPANKPYIIN